MLIPLLLNPIIMIHSIDTLGFSGVMTWLALAVTAMFFTIRAPWTLLAANPLYLMNGVHTVDFYIKAIYIAIVVALAYFFTPSPRKNGESLSFTLPEIFWILYLVLGYGAISWSMNPTLAFERCLYLTGYGVGVYILAKQTKFWRYESFWKTYAAVALVVSVIEMLMYFFGGAPTMEKPFFSLTFREMISFDWIMSAGRPSTTLAYRAYAGTWLSTALPFLAWYMFSKHIKTLPQFLFASATFFATLVATFEVRARSAWIAIAVTFTVLIIIALVQRRWRNVQLRYMPYAAGMLVAALILIRLPMSSELVQRDPNPQALRGTSKEDVVNAVTSIGNFAKVGSNDRFDFWSASRRILFEKSSREKYEHPFGIPAWYLGIGFGQFPLYVPMYTNILHNLGAEIHNDWVQSFVELGPLGFFFLCGFMLTLLYYALKMSKHDSLMLAAVGGILGWVFVTQTDFATPRVYAAIWVAAMAAMIVVESNAPAVLTIPRVPWNPWLRRLGGAFFVWLAFSWGITMWCDRQLYVMFTKFTPADIVTDRVYNKDNWNAYQHGIGKYLIFSPIQDMSKVMGVTIDRFLSEGKVEEARPMQELHKVVLRELLVMHPTSYAFMGQLSDINYRQAQAMNTSPSGANSTELPTQFVAERNRNYVEAANWVHKFLRIKPDDWNTALFASQVHLDMRDSLGAAQLIYRAMQLAPQQGLVQQFWQDRISPQIQQQIIQKMQGVDGLAPIPEDIR